jgi:hypothetical protein
MRRIGNGLLKMTMLLLVCGFALCCFFCESPVQEKLGVSLPRDTLPRDTLPRDTVSEMIFTNEYSGLKVGNSWYYKAVRVKSFPIYDTIFTTVSVTEHVGPMWYLTNKDSTWSKMFWDAKLVGNLDPVDHAILYDSVLSKPEYQSLIIDSSDTVWFSRNYPNLLGSYLPRTVVFNRADCIAGYPVVNLTCDTCIQTADSIYCEHGTLDQWFRIPEPKSDLKKAFNKDDCHYDIIVRQTSRISEYMEKAVYFKNFGLQYYSKCHCNYTNYDWFETIKLLKFNDREIQFLDEALNPLLAW